MSSLRQARRRALWDALLDAEMNVCYWTRLSHRFIHRERLIKFFLALTSSGTAVAAWGFWGQHPQVWKVITGVSCLVSVSYTIFFSPRDIEKMSGILAIWKEIAVRYTVIWDKDEVEDVKEWTAYEETKLRESKIDEASIPQDEGIRMWAYMQVKNKRGINKKVEVFNE